jgi:hypothetical protein
MENLHQSSIIALVIMEARGDKDKGHGKQRNRVARRIAFMRSLGETRAHKKARLKGNP